MPLDPNIILQAGRGVTPLQDPSEMQAKMQQSQLGALQLQQAQRGLADDDAYRQVLQSGVQGADQIAALQKAGLGKQSMEVAKFQTEQQKTQAERGKLVADGMKSGAAMILANPTEENAIQTLTMAQQQYGLPPQMVDNAKSQIYAARNDPNKLRQLAQGWGGDAEKVLGKFTTENLGGTMQTQRVNPITGQVDVAATQARTQSPDSMASVAQSASNAQMTDARMRDQNALRAQANAQGRVPSGYEPDPANPGQLRPITGGPADPNTKPAGGKPLNDTQAKALQFGARMQAAEDVFSKLASGDNPVDRPGLIKRMAESTPFLGESMGAAANWTQSGGQQQAEQAQRDYINAVLRRESGAAISESEFANARKQYFPQAGDTAAVLAQKKANRELATRGILAEVPDSDNRVAQVRGTSSPAAASSPKGKQPPSKTINIGGNEMRAELAPDGNYYVQQNGRWSRVKE